MTTFTNLDELCAYLRERREPDLDWTALPTFGGCEPEYDGPTWSWDQTRLLVGECADDLRIVSREEREGVQS